MMETLMQSVYFMPFLCGLIFLALSLVLLKWPPKEINVMYGYRTPSSMKDQKRWDFAQRFSSRRMLESGLVILAVSFLKLVLGPDEMNEVYVGFSALFLSAAYMIITTERALKKNFPNDA